MCTLSGSKNLILISYGWKVVLVVKRIIDSHAHETKRNKLHETINVVVTHSNEKENSDIKVYI